MDTNFHEESLKFSRKRFRYNLAMLLYEVKLLHPQTQEVIYESLSPQPQLPPLKLQQLHTGAILVINTRNSLPWEKPESPSKKVA